MPNDKQETTSEIKLIGTMPTYRDLFPEQGAVGEKFVIRILQNLYQRDCLLILYQLSKHYYKYCQKGCGGKNSLDIYKQRCFELVSSEIQEKIKKKNPMPPRDYMIIFPEPSIVHLVKLCLRYCDNADYTKNGVEFSQETLHNIGKSLLVVNSIFADWQLKNTSEKTRMTLDLLANLTKQQIVDKNFEMSQKMYQNYFIFKKLLNNYNAKFDLQSLFQEKFGVEVQEYFAFLAVLQGQYDIKDILDEDWALPFLDFDIALKNLKSKYKHKLLDSLLINNMNYKNLSMSFFDVTDVIKRPLVKLPDNKIIPLSLRRLFNRLSTSVYFDLLDSLTNKKEKDKFSQYFGYAVEDYFRDLIRSIDSSVLFPRYGKADEQEANDAVLVQKDAVIFFECKKRPFHNLEFLQKGNGDYYLDRLRESYFKPLDQICERIKDFRDGKFSVEGVGNDALVYPVVVSPATPPLFSGAWDKFNLNQYVLPKYYNEDKSIAPPEFIDFSELEHIEEVLKRQQDIDIVDLIKRKRADTTYHSANFLVFLHKNHMVFHNKRLLEKYLSEVKSFKELLFKDSEKRSIGGK
ncbi:MAG: hypothetical protein KJI72_01360 [Patescibacteria group bacterium]|nr:hypothetical protein [Patescibacteria group bacterium]